MIAVWHNEKFTDYGFGGGTLKGVTIHQVAQVATEDLDEAYRLTNNIDDSWIKNPEVTPIGIQGKGARSTSVGDVLFLNDKGYVVESIGFREVSPEELCQVTFFVPERTAAQ
jgi:hypothetical protein